MRFLSVSSLPVLALLAAAALTSAQTPPTLGSAHIVFSFEHPQLQPSQFTISIDETGAGRFESKPGPVSDPTDGVFPTPLDRPILLDDTLRADLFRYARAHNFFATRCTTAKTSLAFTGKKTLSYSGPDGSGSCTFVWAEDPALQRLADDLGAVAYTLEEGRRLALEVRHDRLSLDAELASLQDALKDHRASDLSNIAEQLHAIADNDQVMDRARKRAQALLARSENPPKRD
ncbi:MAG TPA: hypothetical protein VHE33_18065 [Acidobacteriaceae bacterium]|nr:hypothetical protein [Acidobacteriaceae bacterium]